MAGFTILSATLATSFLTSAVNGAAIERRTNYPPQAPCSYPYTPFDYVGCYVDPSIPNRALDYATDLDFQSMTVEKCTASCKANGFRYAGLEYYGQCFCGNSVRSSPAPQAECNYPCSANQGQTCGGYDRVSIYQDPTFPKVDYTTINDYANLGCYSEGYNGRAINFQQPVDFDTMTTESCLQTCKLANYPLAATEYHGECYCGVVVGNGSVKADESNCNAPCSGNQAEMCGGSNYLNLYVASDLQEAAPCGPAVQPSPTVSPSPSVSSTTAATTPTTTSVASTLPTPSTTSTTSTTSTASTTSTTSTTTTTTTSTTSTTPSSTSTTTTTTTTPTSTTTTSTTPSSTSTTTTTTTTPTSTTTTSKTTTSTAPSSTSTTVSTTSTTTKATTTLTTSTTTASQCTTTAPAPTSEYCVGKFCSKPVPDFKDQAGCKKAHAKCKLQVSDCYKKAGDSSPSCSNFQSFCDNISVYCTNTCSGPKCSKSDCFASNPPAGGPTSTPGVCTATTTAPATTSSCVPPTATNVCAKPTGKAGSGYENDQSVGGIELPYLTCNDLASDYNQHPFKLYEDEESTACRSYTRDNIVSACSDACTVQYNACVGSYATSKKSKDNKTDSKSDSKSDSKKDSRRKRDGGDDSSKTNDDTYDTANTKCINQKSDCVAANKKASSSRCQSYNAGWS